MHLFNDSTPEYWSKTFKAIGFDKKCIKAKAFEDCSFIDCDLSESVFEKCTFIDCEFINCNLGLLKVNHSRFSDVTFKRSKLIGVDWTNATWGSITPCSPIAFTECNISDSSFFGLELKEITLEACKAHNVDFREGVFSKGLFNDTDFMGSLFNNTDLSLANFSESSNYDIDINSNNIKRAKFTRIEALRLLESLDIELLD